VLKFVLVKMNDELLNAKSSTIDPELDVFEAETAKSNGEATSVFAEELEDQEILEGLDESAANGGEIPGDTANVFGEEVEGQEQLEEVDLSKVHDDGIPDETTDVLSEEAEGHKLLHGAVDVPKAHDIEILEEDEDSSSMNNASDDGSAAVSDPDYRCPICLDLQHQPMSLEPCGHTFCDPCLRRLADQGHSNKCPVCRSPIQGCTSDVDLWTSVQESNPNRTAARARTENSTDVYSLPLPPVQEPVAIRVWDWAVSNPYLLITLVTFLGVMFQMVIVWITFRRFHIGGGPAASRSYYDEDFARYGMTSSVVTHSFLSSLLTVQPRIRLIARGLRRPLMVRLVLLDNDGGSNNLTLNNDLAEQEPPLSSEHNEL